MRVVVTKRLFSDADPYRQVVNDVDGEVIYADCSTEADVLDGCQDADIIIGGFVPITERVMDAAGDLQHILIPAAGYDSVDLQAATKRGIPVSNVPEYAPRDVASHAITLALATAHDIVRMDRDLRNGPGWDRSPLQPIHGGTFGIVGLGRIGREVVPMAEGLNMEVIAYDPYLPSDVFDFVGVEPVSFDELLTRCDCVSIHAPLTDITHHMFSGPEFERMAESAILVNTARGPIVNPSALIQALEDGEIRAAGLDVFETEPPNGSPLLDLDRVTCSPHRGAASKRARENMIAGARAELRRALQGETLENVVNPAVFQYTGAQVTVPDE